MVIRSTQIEILLQGGARDFETRMAHHLERCFPIESRVLGEAGLEELIRYRMVRSARYGVTLERDVCKYIDLMIAFNRDFDQNQPWAGEHSQG
jgi:hypothetical protein